MDPLSISLGVIGGVSSLITIYKEGRKFYEKWRSNKKAKKPAVEELQNALEVAPGEVDNQRKSLSRIHGRAFDHGDEISHASFRRISEVLNRNLLGVLRESLHIGHHGDLEPERLWRVSNAARDEAIGTLMDLHQRLMVRAPIPRPFGGREDIAQFPSRGDDSLRVSHPPPPPRSEPQTTSRNLVEDRPEEDLALVPYRATRTASIYSGHSSRPSSSLSLQSSYRDSSYYADASSSSSVSARFRDSVSSSLAVSVLGGPGGRSTADLLRDWKNDLNDRKKALPSPTTPQSPVFLGSNRARQSHHMMRHSSAPSTPSFSHRPFSPIYETQPPSPAISRPGLQYNRDGMVIGERHHSDSYVPSVMRTPKMASVSSTVHVEGGFTHNLPSTTAKASRGELFPDVS